jgi:hypothetical protein
MLGLAPEEVMLVASSQRVKREHEHAVQDRQRPVGPFL